MRGTNQLSEKSISRLYFMPQGWAHLPDELLHSILILLGSTRDLLAFIAVCPSWHAAFMSIKSTLSVLLPPVIFRNYVDNTSPVDSNIRNTWELIDLVYPSTPLRLMSPPSINDTMTLARCSYGHAIFFSSRSHVIMDVLTNTAISAPPCPSTELNYRTITPPYASSDSYLFATAPNCLFVWRFGSPSWLHCLYQGAHLINQIVAFKGQVIAMIGAKLYTVCFLPELRLEALKVTNDNNIATSKLRGTLVACEDMLLLLVRSGGAFFLDLTTKPAKYVRVADGWLEKQAFFIGHKHFGHLRHSTNLERMGLRGSQVYQLDQKAGVFSYPADDPQNGCWPQEPRLQTINTHLSRNPTIFATWV